MIKNTEIFEREPVMAHFDRLMATVEPEQWRFVIARTQKKFPPEPKPLLFQTQGNYRFTIMLDGYSDNYIGDAGVLTCHRMTKNDILLMEPFCANCSDYESGLPKSSFFSVLHRDNITIAAIDADESEHRCYKHALAANDPAVVMLYRSVCTASGNIPERLRAQMLYLLLQLLHHAACREEPVKNRSNALYQQIVNYLQANFDADLDRESVARFFEISPGYLSNLFKEYGGKPFSYVLSDIRIDNAASLLRHTNLTLDAIAAQCGFHYTSYFIRAFHKHFACSPGVYRARQEPLN